MKNIFTPHKLLATSSTSGRLPAQEKYGPIGDFLDRHECSTFRDTRFTHHKKLGLQDSFKESHVLILTYCIRQLNPYTYEYSITQCIMLYCLVSNAMLHARSSVLKARTADSPVAPEITIKEK